MTAAKTKPKWLDSLEQFDPCSEALLWAKKHPTAAAAWKACHRGDWMLWIVGKVQCGEPESDERKRLVLCACECARLALPIWEARYPSDKRVARCIETAERWARGEATINELRTARETADAAADAAAAAAAYAAAAAAADADADADAAAYAAAAAAADADADADADAAAYAARAKTLSQCADIVRKHYPTPPKPQ